MVPREVESIDDIIKEVKNKCNQKKSNEQPSLTGKSYHSKVLFANTLIENQQEPTPEPSSKSTESDDSNTDYDKLLDQLDEEKDEDVIERVLQRYGLKFVHFSVYIPNLSVFC